LGFHDFLQAVSADVYTGRVSGMAQIVELPEAGTADEQEARVVWLTLAEELNVV
jgi:hypothetical protein